jgi:hypothetical protein
VEEASASRENRDSPLRVQRNEAATKSEIRNPKLETNPNDRNSNDPKNLKTKTGKKLNRISRNGMFVVQRRLFLFAAERAANRNVSVSSLNTAKGVIRKG